jgi:hypothetical protein
MSEVVKFNLNVPGASPAASSAPKSALKQAASSAPKSAAPVAGGGGNRGNRGKGRGNQLPSQAEIDAKAAEAAEAAARKAEADAKTAEANARSLRAQADAAKAQADKAEAQVRLNAAQSTAVVTSIPRAKPGATSGGGDFVTHDEFKKFRSEVQTGFTHLSEQNEMTHKVLARFVNMVNPGLPASATAPVSRQIGNSPQEVVEPQRQSYGQNAGWDPATEKPGCASPPQSSFRASSAIACGGAAHSFHREPVGSSTPIHRGSMPEFEAAAARWNKKNSANNARILDTIRKIANGDDDMACLLLALVNGKTYSEIVKMYGDHVASLLSIGNTPFFQRFFTALSSCGLPANFDVKVDSSKTKSADGFVMTYQQLSQAPGNVDKLVRILRGE